MPDENSSSEEELKKQEEEKEQKENEEDEEEFHLHMGKIMQINGFTHISSLSWDKTYDNPTGTSKIELHYPKDKLKNLVKYVYKGASCKAKLRRSTDKEFKVTYIEEIGLDEDGIKAREHYPTEEQKEEVELDEAYQNLLNGDESPQVDNQPKTRSDSDAGIYGFITDVSHSQKGVELEIKDWGYALEDKTKRLSFTGRMRSQVLEEVIKTYGLVPIVDFTGLRDDIINWTNITANDEEDTSSTSGKVIGDDAIEIGNSLASMYSFCKGRASDYETMKQIKCGDCWAWSDALYTELTRIGYTVRIVQYGTSMASNHIRVQIKENGEWIDYPYRQTNIPKLAYNTSGSANGQVILSSEGG